MRRIANTAALVSVIALTTAACNVQEDKTEATDVASIATEGKNLGKSDSPYDRFQGDINFDQRVLRVLPAGVGYHLYRIEVAGQNDAFIDLASREGDDTFLIMYKWNGTSSNWQYTAHNDDCSSNTYNSCLTSSLTEGTYLLLATSYQYANWGTAASVDYEIEVFCNGGTCSGPTVCGTRGAAQCGTDEFCNWDDNQCGALDKPGVCQEIPTACTEQYAPVCGCDGVTYPNECFAAMAGQDIQYTGVCQGSEGATCGGIAALQCNEGLRCDMSGNVGCNIADIAGVCTSDEPKYCTLEYNPVCGCNGVQYSNDCHRRAAGVPLDPDGTCL